MSTFILAMFLLQAKVIECQSPAPWDPSHTLLVFTASDDEEWNDCYAIETDEAWEI